MMAAISERNAAMANVVSTVVLVIMLAAVAPAVAAETDKRPNIVFIMTDDHAVQATSAYGSEIIQTPNIDRIAEEGMRFDRAYVANAICGPSRATILTGTHSHINGFYLNNMAPFDGAQPTVAKLLQAAGYQTALLGKWHLESKPTGFDHWEILSDVGGQGRYYHANFTSADGERPSEGYVGTVITDKALAWLRRDRNPEQPFFLVYQHKAPHREFMPGPQELTNFDDAAQVPEPLTLFDDFRGRAEVRKHTRMTLSDYMLDADVKFSPPVYAKDGELAELWERAFGAGNRAYAANPPTGADRLRWIYQRYIKSYLGAVKSTDREIGRLLDYLDQSGLSESTLVIYTSDQGFFLGEHGWFDKRWIDEESARIPLLVRWPGIVAPGSNSAELVQNLDFAQTMLAAAGVAAAARMQGQSLLPLLAGHTPSDWRDALYYHYYEDPGFHGVPKHYGIITKNYKLVHYYNDGEWELFDLAVDPDELRSVYNNPRYQDVQQRLINRLYELRVEYRVPQQDAAPVWWQAMMGVTVEYLMNFFSGFDR